MRRWTTRTWGIVCAVGATAIGAAYLAAAGAPSHYVAIQLAALGIGLAAIAVLARIPGSFSERFSAPALVLLGTLLLATALVGASVDGAARWVKLGAVYVQTSLVVLPAMLLLFARSPGRLGVAAMALAALALALQPDRAMAGAFAVGLAVLALLRAERLTIAAALCGLGAFVGALAQPDALPAFPFVDRILFTSFDVHPLVGAAVVAGALALLLPALAGGERDRRWVFGATWLAIVSAAALGNYPTPLVGYGGSAVLGYLLSVALLPGAARVAREAVACETTSEGLAHDQSLRAATV